MKYVTAAIIAYALSSSAHAGDVDIYIGGQPYTQSAPIKQDTHTDWYLALRERSRVTLIESNMRLADCTRARMSYEASEWQLNASSAGVKVYYCERAANIEPPKAPVKASRSVPDPIHNLDEYCADNRYWNDLRCLTIPEK